MLAEVSVASCSMLDWQGLTYILDCRNGEGGSWGLGHISVLPGDTWCAKQSVHRLPILYMPLVMVVVGGLTALHSAESSDRVSQEECSSSHRGRKRLRARSRSSVPARAHLLAFLEQVQKYYWVVAETSSWGGKAAGWRRLPRMCLGCS